MASESPIGVDIGGTGIKAGRVDLTAGALIGERQKLDTPHPATPRAVVDVVNQVLAAVSGPGPIGITMPSVVRRGVVLTAANIDKSWIGTDAAALFGQALGRAVCVVNDADAAGMAEMTHGAGKGKAGVVILVTLGTGIGTGVFNDGVLLPNTELGHLPLHNEEAETWAAESARERDNLSWKEWSKRVSSYLQLVETLLWPDLFIIGGGVSRRGDKFIPLLRCETPVVAATLHNDAGIVGAAMVAPGAT